VTSQARGNLVVFLASAAICAGIGSAVASTGWGRHRLGALERRYTARHPTRAIGLWRSDARLGFAHVPSVAKTHETPDFSVTYTTDEKGCRRTPEPARHQGDVLFIGDSFTFGHGVEDGQAYPALLASEHWPHLKVRNCAVMGWSTGQAHVALQQALAREPLPTAVVYAWTAADLRRNYLRKSWLEALGDYGHRNTHFELVRSGVVYRGTVGTEAGIPDGTPQLEERETAITRALIRSMARLCAERSVRFAVVLLATRDRDDVVGDWLAEHGAGAGVTVLDLRTVRGPYFRNDGHPKPAWHRAVARSLARDAAGALGLASRRPPARPQPARS
jgi:hypothetical protein